MNVEFINEWKESKEAPYTDDQPPVKAIDLVKKEKALPLPPKERGGLRMFCGICRVGVPKEAWNRHEISVPHKMGVYKHRMERVAGSKAIVPTITNDPKDAKDILESLDRSTLYILPSIPF